MSNHWSINHSISFRALDHHASEQLHVWSPGTVSELPNLQTFHNPGRVWHSLPTEKAWDGWRGRERVREKPDDTSSSSSSSCVASEKHPCKTFHHTLCTWMQGSWPAVRLLSFSDSVWVPKHTHKHTRLLFHWLRPQHDMSAETISWNYYWSSSSALLWFSVAHVFQFKEELLCFYSLYSDHLVPW